MKQRIVALAMIGMAATTSFAEAWTGPYTGLSYGQTDGATTTTETITEVIPGEELFICMTRCRPTGMFQPDTVETSTTEVAAEVNTQDAGVFAGFRFDTGTFVAGVEAGKIGALGSLAVQGGLDLGSVLVFATTGIGEFEGENGKTYGFGADMQVGPNTLIGFAYTKGEIGNSELEQTTLRVGWIF